MEVNRIWHEESTIDAERQAVLAFAIHDGHAVRDEVAELMALGEADRLREEDPFTADWTVVAPTRVIGVVSRFEVDLNRPRDKAVYRKPEDAWGLNVWKRALPDDVVERSLRQYDDFYFAMDTLLSAAAARYGRFLVLDLHTYNHRRDGPDGPEAPARDNPQVNVGTGTMQRERWAPVVDRFIAELAAQPFPSGALDVRENVRFRGGNFPKWVHEHFPDNACVLALEFKKFFMDEFTGQPDRQLIDAIGTALAATLPPVLEGIGRL